MAWHSSKQAGFALAAILHGDRTLEIAGPYVSPNVRSKLAERLALLLCDADKTHALESLLAEVRPPLRVMSPHLPARARALLARLLPRELGRELVASVSPARTDFVLESDLVATLLRIARKLQTSESL